MESTTSATKQIWYKRPIIWLPVLVALFLAIWFGFMDRKPESKDATKYPPKDTASAQYSPRSKYIIAFQNENDIDFLLIVETTDPIQENSLTDASGVQIFYGKDGGQVINLDDFVNKINEDKKNNVASRKEEAAGVRIDSLSPFTVNLERDMNHSEVLMLQRALNLLGFIVSPEGNGSPGNETRDYAGRTAKALAKFKSAFSDRITDEYGVYNPSGDILDAPSRKFLNTYLNEQGIVDELKASN